MPDREMKTGEGEGGLYEKYRVQKADGSPTDPGAQYFVLRLDAEDDAARIAALVYARLQPNLNLRRELKAHLKSLGTLDAIEVADCVIRRSPHRRTYLEGLDLSKRKPGEEVKVIMLRR